MYTVRYTDTGLNGITVVRVILSGIAKVRASTFPCVNYCQSRFWGMRARYKLLHTFLFFLVLFLFLFLTCSGTCTRPHAIAAFSPTAMVVYPLPFLLALARILTFSCIVCISCIRNRVECRTTTRGESMLARCRCPSNDRATKSSPV